MSDSGPTTVDAAVFDATAGGYDQARRRLVPGFDDFYGAALAELRFAPDADLKIIDLGAGTGLFTDMAARRFPNARFTLIDLSEEMLAKARLRLGDGERFAFRTADLSRVRLQAGADAVISALAIHHLPDRDKYDLYRRAYMALKPGGVFVNAEQVAGATGTLHSRYHWAWMADIRSLGAQPDEIDQALQRMQQDRPTPLDTQLGWLRRIGFEQVDCVYRRGMFAVFSGEMGERPRRVPPL
jgi:tRNA (cmo5U34)-methyltransferase